MVTGRPLLYLSLPGVAFILGVFWFRRRNKNRLEKDDEAKGVGGGNKLKETVLIDATDSIIQKSQIPQQQNGKIPNGNVSPIATSGVLAQNNSGSSKSMNITNNGNGNGNVNGNDVGNDEKESPTTQLFGKSAPIKIQNNGRSSPGKPHHQVDSEILKTKIQDAEHKILRSIDEDFENLSSPVDLPDSVNNRISFYTRTASCKADEPVVIKATRTPKISPENSFLESKYTTECEQNNNLEMPLSSPQPLLTTKKIIEIDDDEKKKKSEVEAVAAAAPVVVESTPVAEEQTIVEELDTSNTEQQQPKRNVDSASPSLSLCSEQSGDSGKGSSLPRSEATRVKTTYEFFFPTTLIGQLYGRKRNFINHIKAKSLANVTLNKNNESNVRICTIEGTENEINVALAMIRQRLPVKRYPNFTMERIHYALPQTVVPLSSESISNLQLKLIESINNDVVVSVVTSAGQIFIQQPLHPSHLALPMLQKCLYESYTNTETPMLPSFELNAICVLCVNGVWYRVEIVDQDIEDEQRCLVKFLDFGGYMNVEVNELRQIRSDFMGVPFQSTECILSNIEPIDTYWSNEAIDVLSKLTKGIVLQAQVAGYNSHNIPEIYLYATLGPNNIIFINKELVARNLARWVDIRD